MKQIDEVPAADMDRIEAVPGSRLVEHRGAMLGRERHDPRVKIRDGFLDRREREATARHIAGAKHAVASRTNGGDARQR